MSCFPCLCLFTYGCVRHILCRGCFRIVYPMLPVSLWLSSYCVPYVASISVVVFVLCTLCCQYLCVFYRIVYPMLPVSLCFLRIVYPMLPVSLNCPFMIASSVFSKIISLCFANTTLHFEWCNKGIHQ